ncbi:MAG: hypothetical protein GWN84_20685 [Gammaproteobacteria bacterium]|nr:hypothetical protein [Gammaproteobacteria bacterium]NIR85178.1 hypothetical protein [Gammaproteobacteria bacterium]NIU06227.1 hypothetical protein [Gammaproteobacteria bacterium]NIX87500.1 hypothetical protein [Gammaproteobacteria bacterium]
MTDPARDELAILQDLQRQLLEVQREQGRLADVQARILQELRARTRRGSKRAGTVARRAAERVESGSVSDVTRARVRQALRRSGL